MAAINDTAPTPTYTEAEERDGFVEYCKLRTCQRMQVERVDELEEVGDDGMNLMRLIAIESKLEWRNFTYEMRVFWMERGSIKATLKSWDGFLTKNGLSVPPIQKDEPVPPPEAVEPHSH